MESDLHVDVLNGKLNPELAKYVEIAHSELDYAWPIDVPRPQNWQLVDVQQSVRMLVARMSAKIFMGEPACRQREWLDVSINFTYDMFMAAFTLRMFPPWMHPLVAHFVPARWRIRKQMAVARKYVGDITREHQDAVAKGDKTEDTLLAWMIDHGKENERKIPEMAARQCVLTLASIHTTSMSISNLLFDLCSHPQWFEVMREEIEQVIAKYGKIGESSLGPKQWLTKLDKMDSLIVECQRMTPPILRKFTNKHTRFDQARIRPTLLTHLCRSQPAENRPRPSHAQRRYQDSPGRQNRLGRPLPRQRPVRRGPPRGV